MLQIELTTTTFELKEGTKSAYKETKKEVSTIDEDTYSKIITSSPFFRRLGGSETAKKGYTSNGYKVVKLTSKSPDRETKIVRQFKFSHND